MPYTKMRELLFELGGIDIGEGTLVATNERVAQAIAPPVEALGTWVKNEQPNVHEPRNRVAGQRGEGMAVGRR